MSMFDKIVAALTPPESAEDRQEARARATSYASRAPWLAMVIDHHRAIDAAFAAVKAGTNGGARQDALKQLGILLTGHAIAEEAVIYPALSDQGETGHATMAYTEQAAAKMQLGLLERMDAMSEDFIDKLGHLEGAVKHHVYQEEGTWFPDLVEAAPAADHRMIAARYAEEYDRYVGDGSASDQAHALAGTDERYREVTATQA
jgi:hemerythrin superfamily protein